MYSSYAENMGHGVRYPARDNIKQVIAHDEMYRSEDRRLTTESVQSQFKADCFKNYKHTNASSLRLQQIKLNKFTNMFVDNSNYGSQNDGSQRNTARIYQKMI